MVIHSDSSSPYPSMKNFVGGLEPVGTLMTRFWSMGGQNFKIPLKVKTVRKYVEFEKLQNFDFLKF